MALASLVANKQVYSKMYGDIRKDWDAKKILRSIEEINPNFYPVPMILQEGTKNLIERPNNYLTKDEFKTAYGMCGEILHRCNPFKTSMSDKYYQKYADFVFEYGTKITNLLNMHIIQLVNEE
jgi:hypothetical protein